MIKGKGKAKAELNLMKKRPSSSGSTGSAPKKKAKKTHGLPRRMTMKLVRLGQKIGRMIDVSTARRRDIGSETVLNTKPT